MKSTDIRLHNIPGNEAAKRSIEVALVGNHEAIFISTVGSPATSLLEVANRIASETGIPFKGHMVSVCPCGAYGNPRIECTCSMDQLMEHGRKMLPLFRKADLGIETYQPTKPDFRLTPELEQVVVERIMRACTNRAEMGVGRDAEDVLNQATAESTTEVFDKMRLLQVATTIARLDSKTTVHDFHVYEAVRHMHPIVRWLRDYQEV